MFEEEAEGCTTKHINMKYNVGQKVIVVDNGKCYPTYYDWVSDNELNLSDDKVKELWSKYLDTKYNYCEVDTKLIIIATDCYKMSHVAMYLCEDMNNNPVLIDETGLDTDEEKHLKWTDLKINDAHLRKIAELEQEKQNYKFEENELKQKLAHMKINELLETAKWADRVYYIDDVRGHLPPCGKCDNRRIHFKSPSGKDLTEECPICGKSYRKYIVKEISSFELHFKTDSNITCKGYFVKHDEYCGSTTYTCQNVYDGAVEDFNINKYNHYYTVFTSKELAQQICDKINKENNVPDNLEIEA